MKKAGTIVLIFVLLITQIALAENLFKNCPDWLTGIFSIDMYGADSPEESWPLDRCICVFDFELDRVDKIKIPYGSIYTKEWQSGGSPVIFYPSEYGYYYFDEYSPWKWREVNYLEIVRTENENGIRYTYGEMLRDFWTGEMRERKPDDNNVYYDYYFSDSPMRILGIKSEFDPQIKRDQRTLFYLQYGVSPTGELEIQMVQEENNFTIINKKIIYRFPLDYSFGAFQYSISNDGKIAWRVLGGIRVCANEYDVKTFEPSGSVLGNPVWYDETSILYLETQDELSLMPRDTILKKYDVCSGTVEDFLNVSGKQIEGSIYPFTMALNEEKNILAVYGFGKPGAEMEMINLDNGERYLFNPWPHTLDEENSDMYRYGYAEDGTLYFEPSFTSQSALVWFPE